MDDYNDAICGIYKKSFTENKITTTNEYDYSDGDVDMTINNGDIEYESNGYKNVLDLTAENSDYLEYKGTKYHETDNSVTANYHGRLYYDETKTFDYQKTFEVYSNTFFNAGVTFIKPEVIEYINLTKLNSSSIGLKTNFYNYGIEANNYSVDTTGITLTATPTADGSKSSMRGSLRIFQRNCSRS